MSWLSNLFGRPRGDRPEKESKTREIGGLSDRDQAIVDDLAADPRIEGLQAELARRAVVLGVGTSTPEDPRSSCFGRVSLALPGEAWPEHGGEPMAALCKLNLTEMPFRTPGLEDLECLTVFIRRDDLPDIETANGDGWRLRAYRDLGELVEIAPAPAHLKPLVLRPRIVDSDYPGWEDAPTERLEAIEKDLIDVYEDLFPNAPGLKLGGWPHVVQYPPFGGSDPGKRARPNYVFQIDSVADWMWGDAGIGYFGRGTARGHEDLWMLEWSCY